MSQSRIISRKNPTSLWVRSLLSVALLLGLSIFGVTTASALPGAPTITSISSSGGSGSIDITVNFTRADPSATPLAGYIYSTDNGANWKQCNVSGICLWNGTSTTLVIQKLSSGPASAQSGDTYRVVIKECETGPADNKDSPLATIATVLGLKNCGASSTTITYLGGSAFSSSAPSISTSSTITHGTISPTAVVTGSGFNTSATASDFTISYGTTTLTGVTTLTFSDTYTANFTFTGTAKAGTISITAKTTAYTPTQSASSNSVGITVGSVAPETPTAVSGTASSSSAVSVSWTAPSYNGGSTITDYDVQYTTETTTPVTWTTFSASASTTSPRSITGLSASTAYVFRVRAYNSNGWGPYSTPSSVVTTNAASSTPPAPQPDPIYPPVISSISKAKVCAHGQDEFIIRGSNFRTATVTIDGVVVTVKGNSDSTINLSFGETTEGIKTIKVTNSAGTATTTVEFKNVEKTAFKVFDIPYIFKGGEFDYTFEAFGENTFRVTGNMPAGLILDPATGRIYGTPTEEGKFNFVLHADGLCGNDVDVIKLDVDKEIPGAMTCRIKFQYKKINKLSAREAKALKDCIKHIKEISPKNIDPVIYISGGAPEGEPETESPEAKERRDSICDMMLTQDLIAQTIAGIFMGPDDEIEIMVYWPVTR